VSFESLRVRGGRQLNLSKLDPEDTSLAPGGKRRTEATFPKLLGELERLQELLYADRRHAVLVVLQGMDSSGKDGTIRHVFSGVNPQGVDVASFKVPTPLELSHDFLWRVHKRAPEKGHIVIFNRSHYEDVLVARVHDLVPRRVWSKRYREINDFERELREEGTTILKFFLHISRKEQADRLRARLDDPTKQWKLTEADARERKFWDSYMEAYNDMLRRTSTSYAPWFAVPSDYKWFRNLVVSTVLVEALRALHLRYPPPEIDLKSFRIG